MFIDNVEKINSKRTICKSEKQFFNEVISKFLKRNRNKEFARYNSFLEKKK